MRIPSRAAGAAWKDGPKKDEVSSMTRTRGSLRQWSRPFRRRFTPSLWIGGGIVLFLLLTALLAPALAQYPPDQIGAAEPLLAPNRAHPFGTDDLGRDMLSRVLYGARIAVEMALLGAGIAAGLGVTLGLMAGYYGKWLDQALSRLVEVWLAFPSLLLAIIIVARLGPSLRNTVIALGIIGAPSFYRLARGGTLSTRQTAFVEAARSLGVRDRHLLLRHILPNITPPLLVLATMRMGVLVLAGGSLSFIGLGAQPPQPEWGALLAAGRVYMDIAPWLAIYPGLCITFSVIGFNLLGDGLRDAWDPRQRSGL